MKNEKGGKSNGIWATEVVNLHDVANYFHYKDILKIYIVLHCGWERARGSTWKFILSLEGAWTIFIWCLKQAPLILKSFVRLLYK